jgi:hypothetical protein
MNEAFSLAERTLCRTCLEEFLSGSEQGQSTDGIAQLVDPTICVHCAADAGNEEWPTLATLPACTTCSSFFRNRPYPRWLKLSSAIFLCVAVGAFIYNLRFFMAYVDLLAANRAMEAGQVEQALPRWESAAARLPEMPELTVIPNLLNAQRLVSESKYDEAMALLDAARPYAGSEFSQVFRQTELGARSGKAFDAKDYDAFLKLSQEAAAMAPEQPYFVASVASAYACKYAVTGNDKFREESLKHLEQAKSLVGAEDEAFRDYENRILHRLHTREIITSEQFAKQFPNGWKAEGTQ